MKANIPLQNPFDTPGIDFKQHSRRESILKYVDLTIYHIVDSVINHSLRMNYHITVQFGSLLSGVYETIWRKH